MTVPPREYNALAGRPVETRTFEELLDAKRPNSYLALDPGDVARVEDRTFICSERKKTPGRPTTGATRGDAEPPEKPFFGLDEGAACTWYPFSMGCSARTSPHRCSAHRLGYVAASMRIMTDGQGALDVLGDGGFVSPASTRSACRSRRGGRRAVACKP